jgi:hypothetical protein
MPSYDRKNPKTQRLPIDAARVAAERQPHTNSTPIYPIITARRRDARAKNMNVHFNSQVWFGFVAVPMVAWTMLRPDTTSTYGPAASFNQHAHRNYCELSVPDGAEPT